MRAVALLALILSLPVAAQDDAPLGNRLRRPLPVDPVGPDARQIDLYFKEGLDPKKVQIGGSLAQHMRDLAAAIRGGRVGPDLDREAYLGLTVEAQLVETERKPWRARLVVVRSDRHIGPKVKADHRSQLETEARMIEGALGRYERPLSEQQMNDLLDKGATQLRVDNRPFAQVALWAPIPRLTLPLRRQTQFDYQIAAVQQGYDAYRRRVARLLAYAERDLERCKRQLEGVEAEIKEVQQQYKADQKRVDELWERLAQRRAKRDAVLEQIQAIVKERAPAPDPRFKVHSDNLAVLYPELGKVTRQILDRKAGQDVSALLTKRKQLLQQVRAIEKKLPAPKPVKDARIAPLKRELKRLRASAYLAEVRGQLGEGSKRLAQQAARMSELAVEHQRLGQLVELRAAQVAVLQVQVTGKASGLITPATVQPVVVRVRAVVAGGPTPPVYLAEAKQDKEAVAKLDRDIAALIEERSDHWRANKRMQPQVDRARRLRNGLLRDAEVAHDELLLAYDIFSEEICDNAYARVRDWVLFTLGRVGFSGLTGGWLGALAEIVSTAVESLVVGEPEDAVSQFDARPLFAEYEGRLAALHDGRAYKEVDPVEEHRQWLFIKRRFISIASEGAVEGCNYAWYKSLEANPRSMTGLLLGRHIPDSAKAGWKASGEAWRALRRAAVTGEPGLLAKLALIGAGRRAFTRSVERDLTSGTGRLLEARAAMKKLSWTSFGGFFKASIVNAAVGGTIDVVESFNAKLADEEARDIWVEFLDALVVAKKSQVLLAEGNRQHYRTLNYQLKRDVRIAEIDLMLPLLRAARERFFTRQSAAAGLLVVEQEPFTNHDVPVTVTVETRSSKVGERVWLEGSAGRIELRGGEPRGESDDLETLLREHFAPQKRPAKRTYRLALGRQLLEIAPKGGKLTLRIDYR